MKVFGAFICVISFAVALLCGSVLGLIFLIDFLTVPIGIKPAAPFTVLETLAYLGFIAGSIGIGIGWVLRWLSKD